MIVMLVMAAIAYPLRRCSTSAIFAAALAGACVGFLWFNSLSRRHLHGRHGLPCPRHGARLRLRCLTKTEVDRRSSSGGLFVAEALSVMIQVVLASRPRVSASSSWPRIHHHFEKKGWAETKVVIRFWIVSGVLAALGFAVYFAETLMAVA